MADRLADAMSPYLRSHATNPVDWYPWGAEAFAEASRRDVPVLVSIGYSTCHWCHVMSRESFSDPAIAARLAEDFVAIKVDREEHPDVDASYLAAAAAFTDSLGWPLNVFVTPEGQAFYAGTYWPPTPAGQSPSFVQVLEAVTDAWSSRRAEVEETARAVSAALREQAESLAGPVGDSRPCIDRLDAAVDELVAYEDGEFGGFGGAPKFPVAPVLLFLLERASGGDRKALALARRALAAISGQGLASHQSVTALRDRVEGGFFRYATRRDWSEPHFERMLYDNAQLLMAFTRLVQLDSDARETNIEIAEGIAGYLIEVMEQPEGGFASAQDSESIVDGVRREGTYFALGAVDRQGQVPPALDAKILTGWNGLAIGALATAGFVSRQAHWLAAARRAADVLIARHLRPDGTLLRASIDRRISNANATLEDYGMLASGLLELSTATGEASYALVGKALVDSSLSAAGEGIFGVPGGGDPVLTAQGTAIEHDPSEGAYPSGLSAMARASASLYLLTGDRQYREASERVIAQLMPLAARRPVSFGETLAVASALSQPIEQLVVVSSDPNSELADVARARFRSGRVTAVVTPAQAMAFAAAGFELFVGRDQDAAYLCQDFVCRLPVMDPAQLSNVLDQRQPGSQ